MAKKITGPQVLTANLLGDGRVVFFGSDGAWRSNIDGAQVARSQADAATLTDRGAESLRSNLVVDPYLIEIVESAGGLSPAEFRERRRISGPSVALAFNTRAHGREAIAA